MISGVAEITSRMRRRQLGVAGRKLSTAEDAEIPPKASTTGYMGFHRGNLLFTVLAERTVSDRYNVRNHSGAQY